MSEPPDASRDSDPITSAEFLLRRIPSEPGQYEFSLSVPRFGAFLPNKGDVDGLSLNRECHISAEALLAAANNPNVRAYGGVLAVLVQWLFDLGLSVRNDPVEDTPGHVVIPELNRKDYDDKKQKEKKQQILDWADQLARRVGTVHVRIPPKQKG